MNTKILDKLQKMRAMAESAAKIGNENEAQAFAEMMQRMMLEHEISMTDIEARERDASEPVDVHQIDYTKHNTAPVKARVLWREQLAEIIAMAHFCRILIYQKSSRITLVGRKSDCEVAEFMIITLMRLLEKMSVNEWRKEWRRLGGHESPAANRDARVELSGFDTTYRTAFIQRLRQRYDESKRATVSTAATSSSTALVRIERKMDDVNAFVSARFTGTAKELKRSSKTNTLGWQRGREAADKINLGATAMREAKTSRQIMRASYVFSKHDVLQIKRSGEWLDFSTLRTEEDAQLAKRIVDRETRPGGTDSSHGWRIRRVLEDKTVYAMTDEEV